METKDFSAHLYDAAGKLNQYVIQYMVTLKLDSLELIVHQPVEMILIKN